MEHDCSNNGRPLDDCPQPYGVLFCAHANCLIDDSSVAGCTKFVQKGGVCYTHRDTNK